MGVNRAYSGQRYNTPEHRKWVRDVLFMLPKITLPKPPFQIYFKFGYSNPACDWDGAIKICQDVIAMKYNFNDKLIRRCVGVDTEIVQKGKEYFIFNIESLKS